MTEAIYIAAKFTRKLEMRTIAAALSDFGYKVASRWIEQQENDDDPPSDWADRDVEEVGAADTLVLFTETEAGGYTTGGRFVELGIAIAWDKRIIIVGPLENIFCHLYGIEQLEHFSINRLLGILDKHPETRKTGCIEPCEGAGCGESCTCACHLAETQR